MATEVLNIAVEIAKGIYDRVELVKSNKKRWAGLIKLIEIALSTLVGLEELPRSANFLRSLEALKAAIDDASMLLESMVGMSFFERFRRAGENRDKLDDIKNDVYDHLQLLQLAIAGQHLVNYEKDRQEALAKAAEKLVLKERDRQADLEDQEDFVREEVKRLRESQLHDADLLGDSDIIIDMQKDDFEQELLKILSPDKRKLDAPALPEEYNVKLYDIVFEKKLNNSRTGAIYRGRWKGQAVLIKRVDGAFAEVGRLQFIREAQIMSRIRNQHIVQFYGACLEPGRMCIVTGIVDNRLLDVLDTLSSENCLHMAKDLIDGLVYLHDNGVVHNDIHPSNIGVTRRHEAKWMDLSWVKTTSISLIESVGVAHDSNLWQAPEIWGRRDLVGKESDIYSFGLLLWTLFTKRLPFPGRSNDNFLRQVQKGLREDIPDECPDIYADLIRNCWDVNPAARPMAIDVRRALECVHFKDTEVRADAKPHRVKVPNVGVKEDESDFLHRNRINEKKNAGNIEELMDILKVAVDLRHENDHNRDVKIRGDCHVDGMLTNADKLKIEKTNAKNKLGQCGFGESWKGSYNCETVAVTFVVGRCDSRAAQRAFLDEITTIMRLSHPRIVQFIGTTVRGSDWLVVQEFCMNGSVDKLIESDARFRSDFDRRISMLIDAAEGVQYMHQRNVVHFDLKPGNLLVGDDGRVKVSDFGLAKAVHYLAVPLRKSNDMILYMPPELMASSGGGPPADVYSFGIIIYEVLSLRSPPFQEVVNAIVTQHGQFSIENFKRKVLSGSRPELPPEWDGRARAQLCKSCWRSDADERVDIEKVVDALKVIREGNKHK